MPAISPYSGSYSAIDNPNIPVHSPLHEPEIPFGKFVHLPGDNPLSEGNSVEVRDLYLSNASVRLIQGQLNRHIVAVNKQNIASDHAGFCLFLDGYFESYVRGANGAIVGKKDEHNFKFDPNSEMMHFLPGETPFRLLHFSTNISTLAELLPEDEKWSDTLRTKLFRRERILSLQSARMDGLQKEAVRTILHCPLGGKTGQVLMETSVYQLLLLQLHALFYGEENSANLSVLSRRDRELAKALHEFLAAHFLEEHTVVSLARRFGTNSNKLMKVFKTEFDQSIFEYLGELKMQHAEHLLKEQAMLVGEVATVLGYKNPHHFSAAFKKKFQVCPSTLRCN